MIFNCGYFYCPYIPLDGKWIAFKRDKGETMPMYDVKFQAFETVVTGEFHPPIQGNEVMLEEVNDC